MIPLDFSYIICDYKNKINIKKPCEILNCYENAKKDSKILEGENNEEEISKNCDLYLNNKKIDFTFSHHFEIKQNYNIKIIVKKSLINLNYEKANRERREFYDKYRKSEIFSHPTLENTNTKKLLKNKIKDKFILKYKICHNNFV